jgi:hypothetical protein
MVIVVLRVLSLNDSWLLVLSGVGRRRAVRAAAGGGAAVVVLVAGELVVNLLLQVVKSSALLLLVVVLLEHLLGAGAGAGLSRVCLVLFTLVLGNGDNVVLGDMLLSGFYDRRVVLVSRRVGRRENGERDRNSSVKVQIESLQREGAPDRELPSNYLVFWLREKCCNRDIHVTTENRRWEEDC